MDYLSNNVAVNLKIRTDMPSRLQRQFHVTGADSAAEGGLLSGDAGRTGSYQGGSRTVQGMDLSAL